jgi:hypothetical protein
MFYQIPICSEERVVNFANVNSKPSSIAVYCLVPQHFNQLTLMLICVEFENRTLKF